MCKASVSDVINHPSERRAALDGRLMYAPVQEMTDDFIREAAASMQEARQRNELAGGSGGGGGGAAFDRADIDDDLGEGEGEGEGEG